MNKTLLFVVNVDWFFLSHRLPIALAAIEQGYRVHIATGLTGRRAELEHYGMTVHPLRLDRSSIGVGNALSALRQLFDVYQRVRPDLVHLVTIKPVLLGGLMARLCGVPAVVAAVSGLGFVFVASGFKAALRRWLVGGLYRLALGHRNLKVIFQNPDDRASLAGIADLADSRVAFIRGSGVDLVRFSVRPQPQGVPLVVLAARLLGDKGVREFAQAARLLRQPGNSPRCGVVRFVLVGGPDPANPSSLSEAELAAWVQEGVLERWGQRADMPQVFAAAQLVVLPSYREGFPKVLIEAAACGRAVVTTDVPGCRDAIEADVTGLLVPAYDARALADAIKRLLDDPQRCQAMGQAGRALAERVFDVRQVVAAHLHIYQELIAVAK
ncbi:MAG: glycosyltransferase family 4 protein [Rhodocyclaceae bacterium]